MHGIFLYLLFLTSFPSGFAHEKSLSESADSNLLVAELPSAEENLVPDDGDSVNVEEILRELNSERAKNRDLNQIIWDILERMADMERDISRNKEEITENQSSVVLLNKDVEDLQDEVVTVAEDVERNSANITIVAEDVERNSAIITIVFEDVAGVQEDVESLSSSDQQQAAQIQSLGTRGTWCGYQGSWTTASSTITYERLILSDSNMNITRTPLDINTGIFTVPMSGVWRVTFSVHSRVDSGDTNASWLFINGKDAKQSEHYFYSESGNVFSTGGRVVIRKFSQGDNMEFRTTRMDGIYYKINFCAEYVPKM